MVYKEAIMSQYLFITITFVYCLKMTDWKIHCNKVKSKTMQSH